MLTADFSCLTLTAEQGMDVSCVVVVRPKCSRKQLSTDKELHRDWLIFSCDSSPKSRLLTDTCYLLKIWP